jgi:uncharacterized membrane protein
MESKVRLFGHSVHQMLIVFPLGLLGMSAVFDLLFFGTDQGIFAAVAYWMIVAGLVGGLLAAPFGLIDWLAVPKNTRARRLGAYHGIGNALVLVLYLLSVLLRDPGGTSAPTAAYVYSFTGVMLAVCTGWMGGELVDRLGVGIHDGANLDAPSSLRKTHRII